MTNRSASANFESMFRLRLPIPPMPAFHHPAPLSTSVSPRSLPVICWIAVIFLSGCNSSSGVFRVRNPMEEETKAVSEWWTNRKLPPDERAEQDDGRGAFGAGEDQDASSPHYFGRGTSRKPSESPAPSLFRKSNPAESPAASSAPPMTVSGDSRQESAPVFSPPPTGERQGKPCYQCNGKGYRLDSLQANAEFVSCAACQGTGRQ